MILYDLVNDARTILIDTNSANFRWSNAFFEDAMRDCRDILWDSNISLFYDEYGRVSKDDYIYSDPVVRSTAYATTDYVHNSDSDIFLCTTAGTTGASVPTWNLGYNATTTDGTAVFTYQDSNLLPFPDSIRRNLVAYLIFRAYEIDSTDQNNAQLAQNYYQKFGEIL